jgi:polyphosphate kinase 2 (PPK2 family)
MAAGEVARGTIRRLPLTRTPSGFPAVGEAVIFDCSWYNRAGVMVIEYWLEVNGEEQARRRESRIDDPRKVGKLFELGLISYSRWYDYSRARDDMLATTDTAWAPWYTAHADGQERACLNVATHLFGQVPLRTHPPREGHLVRPSAAPP